MSGYIIVDNRGAYIARFFVKYTGPDGKRVNYDSGDFTEGVKKSCELPAGSTYITLKIQELALLGEWSTILIEEFPTVVRIEIELLGTALDPYYRKRKV